MYYCTIYRLYAVLITKLKAPPPQVPVPRFAVGIVIGRNGEMIKKIQNDAGVRIQFKAGLFTPVPPLAQSVQLKPVQTGRKASSRTSSLSSSSVIG